VSTSCLRIKKEFHQTLPGLSGGLQVIMFTGYPGLGQVPLFKALDRKPSLLLMIDPPSSLVSPQKTPVNIKTGQRTSIQLTSNKNTFQPEPMGFCDPRIGNVSQPDCHFVCIVRAIAHSECECIP